MAQEVAGVSVGGSGSTQQGQLAGTWVREGFLEEAAFGMNPVVGGSEAEGETGSLTPWGKERTQLRAAGAGK